MLALPPPLALRDSAVGKPVITVLRSVEDAVRVPSAVRPTPVLEPPGPTIVRWFPSIAEDASAENNLRAWRSVSAPGRTSTSELLNEIEPPVVQTASWPPLIVERSMTARSDETVPGSICAPYTPEIGRAHV